LHPFQKDDQSGQYHDIKNDHFGQSQINKFYQLIIFSFIHIYTGIQLIIGGEKSDNHLLQSDGGFQKGC